MTIDTLATPSGPDLYYDQGFRNTLEDHMSVLRNDPKCETILIEPYKTIVYEGDLFGMLSDLTIPRQYHWVIMRMNNINNPTDFGPGMESIIVPDTQRLERMRSLYMTQNKIKK